MVRRLGSHLSSLNLGLQLTRRIGSFGEETARNNFILEIDKSTSALLNHGEKSQSARPHPAPLCVVESTTLVIIGHGASQPSAR